MASLASKVIAITGASGGMGIATARLLAKRGASLSLCDLDGAKLGTLKNELGQPGSGQLFSVHAVDISKSAQVDNWIQETVNQHGRLDGAANLAGITGTGGSMRDFKGLADYDDQTWDKVMRINCSGTFFAMRAQLRAMRSGGGGGAIINTASMAALVGIPGTSPYNASKHAVVGLTKAAAREYGPDNIRVNAIAPGLIETPMSIGLQQPNGNWEDVLQARQCIPSHGKPKDIAEFLAFLLSDSAKFITGAVLPIDGGFTT